MKRTRKLGSYLVSLGGLVLIMALGPAPALAHCDTMDGPVIKAAIKALEKGSVDPVLIWVQKADEAEVRRAFDRALDVRKLGPQARELADRYFFETIVRLHRAGEGAPYTGLEPAGKDLGRVIPASDKAIADGNPEALLELLVGAVRTNVPAHFEELMALKTFPENDVESGRRFVKAYVIFTHYVERLYDAAGKPAEDHRQPAAAGSRD